jgi:hypothetical protein
VGSHHVGAWRNLYAHLMAEMGWAEFSMNFAELELFADLARRPRATLDVTYFVHQITKNQTESGSVRQVLQRRSWLAGVVRLGGAGFSCAL